MPRPVPIPVRQAIWRRFQDGQDGPTIARDLGLAPRTVRRLLAPLPVGRPGGPGSLLRPLRGGDAEARRVARAGRPGPAPRAPDLGGGADPRDAAPPAPRRPAARRPDAPALVPAAPGSPPRRRGGGPPATARRAVRPHEVWQMDAAELVPLRTGQRVCWLRVVDECSGAVLWTAVFPPGRWSQVPPAATQAQLAAGLRPLGPARAVPGGQRGAVGRRAATCRPTWRCGCSGWGWAWTGTRRASPAGQRGGGAVAGDGQAVGRAAGPATPRSSCGGGWG